MCLSGDGVISGISSEDLWLFSFRGKHASQIEITALFLFSTEIRNFALFPPNGLFDF